MLIELLSLPERRMSIGPELIRFFEQHVEGDWGGTLNNFLKTFAGTSFEIPGPSFLMSIKADESIIKSLRTDDSIEARVAAMQEYKVSYAHMLRIWQVVEGKMLPSPEITGRNNAVVDAAILIRRHPKLECDVAQMYSLTTKERVKVMEMVRNMIQSRMYKPCTKETKMAKKEKPVMQPKPTPEIVVPKRVTAAQRRFIAALKSHGAPSSPGDMKKMIGTIIPTKTINSLVEQGLLRQSKRGMLSLTVKGKKVA